MKMKFPSISIACLRASDPPGLLAYPSWEESLGVAILRETSQCHKNRVFSLPSVGTGRRTVAAPQATPAAPATIWSPRSNKGYCSMYSPGGHIQMQGTNHLLIVFD